MARRRPPRRAAVPGRARRRGPRARRVRAGVPEVGWSAEPARVPARRDCERVPQLAVASQDRAREAPVDRGRDLDRLRVRRARRCSCGPPVPPARGAGPPVLRGPARVRDRGSDRMPTGDREVAHLARARRAQEGSTAMRQSTADLESRLRELFERQAAGMETSTGVWDDIPMVRTDELAPRRRSRPAFAAVAATAAAVLLIIGVVAASPARDAVTVGGPGTNPPAPLRFATPHVVLSADALVIDAEGRQFTPAGRTLDVHSDPGTPNYTTLELTWEERGVEMRLYMYFKSDGHNWWSNEIRTYNGHAPGDWITYDGTFFRSALGRAFTGDVDFEATSGHGRLQLTGLRLRAFLPPAACEGAASKLALDIA